MLAKRIPSILPRFTLNEALETTKVWSVAGKLTSQEPLKARRVFHDPHHTTSYPGHVDGGVDPQGPLEGQFRVLRGGSWDVDAWRCRCAARGWNAFGSRADCIGFRVVVLAPRTP